MKYSIFILLCIILLLLFFITISKDIQLENFYNSKNNGNFNIIGYIDGVVMNSNTLRFTIPENTEIKQVTFNINVSDIDTFKLYTPFNINAEYKGKKNYIITILNTKYINTKYESDIFIQILGNNVTFKSGSIILYN